MLKYFNKIFSKNNITTTIISKDSSSKDISINNLRYTVTDLDNIFPALDVKPTTSLEAIMFNAGQRSVISFLLSKEGRQ
jgi:hypothetical protein